MIKLLNITISISILILMLVCDNYLYAQNIKSEKLPDGVERWYLPTKTDELPSTFKMIENNCVIKFLSPKKLPWNRSIALLVGVSNYKHISPQLPSVEKDIDDMKNYLLNKGGFDEVFIARDGIVNRDLIEKYIKEIFPNKFNKDDRILFYYSGHGGDEHDRTGYMQFSNANPKHFWGNDVMPIDNILNWSNVLDFKHMIFIIDCCASGLVISPKSGNIDQSEQLIKTLSGNGSRVILTAGTAEQNICF